MGLPQSQLISETNTYTTNVSSAVFIGGEDKTFLVLVKTDAQIVGFPLIYHPSVKDLH